MRDFLMVFAIAGLLAVGLLFAAGQVRTSRTLKRLDNVLDTGVLPNLGVRRVENDARLLPVFLIRKLQAIGIELKVRDAVLALAAFLVLVFGIAVLLNPLAAVMFGVTLTGMAYAVLNVVAARRLAQMGAALPSFFERVRQLLTIGNSLPMAFGRSVRSSQPMLVQFFAPTVRRLGNGAGFSESIQQCADDADVYELRLFAAAVTTNMRFGGSLNLSLSNLVAYLRKRASIERELRSSTAQIRGSAWVLGLLPLLVASLIVGQNQEYARWFVSDPSGRAMLVYCIVSQIVGAFVMRKIVRTRY